jgi:hypothetical protein
VLFSAFSVTRNAVWICLAFCGVLTRARWAMGLRYYWFASRHASMAIGIYAGIFDTGFYRKRPINFPFRDAITICFKRVNLE